MGISACGIWSHKRIGWTLELCTSAGKRERLGRRLYYIARYTRISIQIYNFAESISSKPPRQFHFAAQVSLFLPSLSFFFVAHRMVRIYRNSSARNSNEDSNHGSWLISLHAQIRTFFCPRQREPLAALRSPPDWRKQNLVVIMKLIADRRYFVSCVGNATLLTVLQTKLRAYPNRCLTSILTNLCSTTRFSW